MIAKAGTAGRTFVLYAPDGHYIEFTPSAEFGNVRIQERSPTSYPTFWRDRSVAAARREYRSRVADGWTARRPPEKVRRAYVRRMRG